METTPEQRPPRESRLTRLIQRFAHVMTLMLLVLLMVVVAIATVEMGWLLVRDLMSVGDLPLEVAEIYEAFKFFLLILIGLELINLLHVLYRAGVVKVQFVIEAALISVAQNLIVLDTARVSPMTMLGLATLVLALAIAIRWYRREPGAHVSS